MIPIYQTSKQDSAHLMVLFFSFYSLTCPLILLQHWGLVFFLLLPFYYLFLNLFIGKKLAPFLLRLGFSLTLKECTGLIHFVAILSAYLPFFPFLLSRAYLWIQYLLAWLGFRYKIALLVEGLMVLLALVVFVIILSLYRRIFVAFLSFRSEGREEVWLNLPCACLVCICTSLLARIDYLVDCFHRSMYTLRRASWKK